MLDEKIGAYAEQADNNQNKQLDSFLFHQRFLLPAHTKIPAIDQPQRQEQHQNGTDGERPCRHSTVITEAS